MIGVLLSLLVAMSWRRVDFTEGGFARFVRDVYDRLDRLDRGNNNRGRASFANVIRIGDIEIGVTNSNGNIAGVLTLPMLAGDNDLVLDTGDAAAFPDPPYIVQIEDELIYVLGKDDVTDTFSPLGRGYNGTLAAAHAAGKPVRLASPTALTLVVRNIHTGSERLLAVLP